MRTEPVALLALCISTQGDLMMIRFPYGTDDVIPKARRIYETAKARM